MDNEQLKAVRFQNVRLIADFLSADAFAQRMNLPPARKYQLLNGHGTIGNNTVKKIESTFGLVPGFMDIPHDAVTEKDFNLSNEQLLDFVQILAAQVKDIPDPAKREQLSHEIMQTFYQGLGAK